MPRDLLAGPEARDLLADMPEPVRKEEGPWRRYLGAAIEPNLALLSGAVATPISGLMGLGVAMGKNAGIPMFEGMDPAETVRTVGHRLTYQPSTEGGQHAMAAVGYLPGKLAEFADTMGQGVVDATGSPELGAIANTAIQMAPTAIGMRSGASAKPSSVARVSNWMSERLMRSALKPSKTKVLKGDADKAVRTMLDEGMNATESGLAKLTGKIDALDSDVAARIASSPEFVGKDAVLRRLGEVSSKARNQVNPQADLAAIEQARARFAEHPQLPRNAIPIQKAQELKRGTYKQLSDKAYGEMATADVEAQKALARGLKEEIERLEPSVAPINAKQSELINASKILADRLATEGNKNPLGLGPIAPSTSRMIAFLLDRSAAAKSMLARGLNPGRALGLSDESMMAAVMGPSFQQDAENRQRIIDELMRR